MVHIHAIRRGGGCLVDKGVSTMAYSERFLRRNAALLRASTTKVPELKGGESEVCGHL